MTPIIPKKFARFTLRFSSVRRNLLYLVSVTLFKLTILPTVMVISAYHVGLRGVQLFIALMVFATPVATTSYPMAQNLGGDGELAGQYVVFSTVLSVLTLFIMHLHADYAQ